jgi:type I restriction enzyme M protein
MTAPDIGDLKGAVWAACETFRADLPPQQGRDHVVVLVFLKYLSDWRHDVLTQYRAEYGHDEERIARRLGRARFIVPSVEVHEASGQFVIDRFLADIYELNIRRDQPNLGELVDLALTALASHNKGKLERVFAHVSFNGEGTLGPLLRRNVRLKQFIATLAYLDLRNNPGSIALVFRHLLERFAHEDGKNAAAPPLPTAIARLLLALAHPGENASIADPVCGSGDLLIEAAQYLGQRRFALFGQEPNQSSWAMARMNLFIHGLDGAHLELGDSLVNPLLLQEGHLQQFDTVLVNPPPCQREQWYPGRAEQDPFGRFWRGTPPRGKADYAWISHCLEITRPQSGQLAILAPHAVLFRGGAEKRIRKRLLSENLLDAVVALPAHFFATPQVILLFDRAREAGGARAHVRDVLLLDAGTDTESGLPQIVQEVQLRQPNGRRVYLASPEEVAANDHDLNLPRYLFDRQQRQGYDLALARAEIDEMEQQLALLRSRLQQQLATLN